MSGVFITGGARPPVQIAQYVRNGKTPSAEFQSMLADLIGFAAKYTPKVIYCRAAPIGAIPSSESGSRSRWNFMFRTSTYCKTLAVQMFLAPQDNMTPTSPYGKLLIKEATIVSGVVTSETSVAEARVNWGSSDGSYADVPRNFGGGLVTLVEPGTNTPVDLDPETDYTAYLTDEDYARVFAITVWEIALAPDTDNGYPSTGVAADAPIYDEDRQDAAVMLRNLWQNAGQHLWNGGAETDDDIVVGPAPVTAALTSSIGTFTLSGAATVTAPDSLTLDLLAYDEGDSLQSTWLTGPEGDTDKWCGYEIDVEAVGSHTDVEIVLTLPYQGSTSAGIVRGDQTLGDIETLLEAANSGWTVVADDSSTAGPLTLTFTISSLAEGSHTLYAKYTDGFSMFWEWGTSSSPGGGTVYTGPCTVTVTGGSNEDATATGYSETSLYVSDYYLGDVTFDPDPATEDVEVEFTVTARQYGNTGSNSVVVQISDAVTCSEPTVSTNTDGWSVGSWSSPGGGVQWQATMTLGSLPSSGAGPSSVVFATTPSTAGTLAVNVSGSSNTGYTATSGGNVTVDSAATWSVDATSGIGAPADSTEWATINSSESLSAAPDNLWLMQEASGNLSDSIGAITLTASGTVSYQNAISGWSRYGLGTTDGTAGKWGVSSGTGPDPSSTSVAALLYVRIDNVTTERNLLSLTDSSGNLLVINVTAGGLLRAYVDTNNASGGTNYEAGSVFPLLFVYDRTNSRARVFTDVEKISPTYGSGTADGLKFFGGNSTAVLTGRYLYGAWFTGSDAEWLSTDANAKALLEALGWTVSGY